MFVELMNCAFQIFTIHSTLMKIDLKINVRFKIKNRFWIPNRITVYAYEIETRLSLTSVVIDVYFYDEYFRFIINSNAFSLTLSCTLFLDSEISDVISKMNINWETNFHTINESKFNYIQIFEWSISKSTKSDDFAIDFQRFFSIKICGPSHTFWPTDLAGKKWPRQRWAKMRLRQ